jgi:hypothetical protein
MHRARLVVFGPASEAAVDARIEVAEAAGFPSARCQ